MKAVAVSPDNREVALVDHEEPTLARSTDVKLRMLDVGVCGTDREIAPSSTGRLPVARSVW